GLRPHAQEPLDDPRVRVRGLRRPLPAAQGIADHRHRPLPHRRVLTLALSACQRTSFSPGHVPAPLTCPHHYPSTETDHAAHFGHRLSPAARGRPPRGAPCPRPH